MNMLNALGKAAVTGNSMMRLKNDVNLNNVYQQHGQGIAAGDQNALNALAAVDPMQAYAIQQQNRNFALRERTENRQAQQFDQQMEQYAASLDAAAAKAEAEKIKQGVFMASSAQTPEQWDQIAIQLGQTDLVGQFEMKDALLQKYMTAVQILEAQEVPGPQSPAGKLAADLEAGLITQEQFDAATKKDKGTSFVVGPDGTVTYSEGGVEVPPVPKLTVDAAKNSGFLIRTRAANEVLNALENEGLNFWQQNAEHIPLGLGNYTRSPEFQKFDQARRDFVNAILRRESGAVISDQEFDNADKQYFPVPGDSPEVIAQKRKNRENAIAGLRVGSGEGAAYVDQAHPPAETPAQETVTEQAFKVPEVPNFTEMTDEELDAYIQKMSGQ